MNIEEFSLLINEKIGKLNEKKIKKLYEFMNLLLDENKKYNLTSITDPKEVIVKHFADSLSIEKYINSEDSIIDVGTGAGFPGIPLAIDNEKNDFLLLDSLNKRINFLNIVKEKIKLDNVKLISGRAEDVASNEKYREKFNVAISRAVAPLNVLLEYLIPFVKVDGICICMKGPNYKEELPKDDVILRELGGKIEKIETIEKFGLSRKIIIVKKVKKINKKYPRKAGIPKKKPLW